MGDTKILDLMETRHPYAAAELACIRAVIHAKFAELSVERDDHYEAGNAHAAVSMAYSQLAQAITLSMGKVETT